MNDYYTPFYLVIYSAAKVLLRKIHQAHFDYPPKIVRF